MTLKSFLSEFFSLLRSKKKNEGGILDVCAFNVIVKCEIKFWPCDRVILALTDPQQQNDIIY